jgi:hypothetical protein
VAELVDARDLKYVLAIVFINKIRPSYVVEPIENYRKLLDLHNNWRCI